MVDATPFPISPELTAVAIQYRNPAAALIADLVLPRLQPMGVKSFKYLNYALADAFTIPNTAVSRKGMPEEIEIKATEVDASCLDYGLDDVVPNDDIIQARNAPSNGGFAVDPLMTATQYLTDLLLLDREVRTANLVFATGSYGGNTLDLSGGGQHQWSDFVDGDPIADISTGLDNTVGFRPNTLVFGQAVWTKVRQHPKIVKAMHGNDGGSGLATRQAVAELFEVQNVLVGSAYVNTAKKGQTASLARAWGKHCAALFINPVATNREGVTFGFTAQFQGRFAGSISEPKTGLRGAERVRVGESVKEIVSAPKTSFFWQNAVA